MENAKAFFSLAPCPFCGSTDLSLMGYDPCDGYQGDLYRYRSYCGSCGCAIERSDRDLVILAWNRRWHNDR